MKTKLLTHSHASGASRRRFLQQLGLGTALFTVRGRSPRNWLRPRPGSKKARFIRLKLPLDTDNDLIIVNDSITPAIGEITHLSGRCSTPRAIRFATPPSKSGRWITRGFIWPTGQTKPKFDANFQGFWPFSHQFHRRILFSHVEARWFIRKIAAYSFQGQDERARRVDDPAFYQGFPGNARDGVYQGNWQRQGSGSGRGGVCPDERFRLSGNSPPSSTSCLANAAGG